MSEQVMPAVQDFLMSILTGVLALASAFIIALAKKGFDWITAKIDTVKNEDARVTLSAAVSNLETIVKTTVTSLQQTLGDEIKKSIENQDGMYTREDLLNLGNTAFEIVKSQLTDSAKEVLSSAYNDLDSFIKGLIETSVRNLKNEALNSINS